MPRRRVLPVITLSGLTGKISKVARGCSYGSSSAETTNLVKSGQSLGVDHPMPPRSREVSVSLSESNNMGNLPISIGRKSANGKGSSDTRDGSSGLNSKRNLLSSDENTSCDLSGAALSSGIRTPTKMPRHASIGAGRQMGQNVEDITTNSSDSCASSNSSVKGKIISRKPCPAKFRCTRCQGEARKPPMGSEDLTSDENTSAIDHDEPIICCSSPFCKAPKYHLKCAGVPTKSQAYYNATNSRQVKPLSPGSISRSHDTPWWNFPIRNSIRPEDQKKLSSSDAIFGSFQLYDEDPTSSISSFVCPSCDVEGSSRYLMEYFELFHAMKKTYYSRYLTDEAPDRKERMSECVEARTGDGIIKYLARMHAIDCQQHDDEIFERCVASEINISAMKSVLEFLKMQLPLDEQKQSEKSANDCTESGAAVRRKRAIASDEASRSSADHIVYFTNKPKSAKKRNDPALVKGSATRLHSKNSGINWQKYNKKWEVKSEKYLGSYKTYEEALAVKKSYEEMSTDDTAAMTLTGSTPYYGENIGRAVIEVDNSMSITEDKCPVINSKYSQLKVINDVAGSPGRPYKSIAMKLSLSRGRQDQSNDSVQETNAVAHTTEETREKHNSQNKSSPVVEAKMEPTQPDSGVDGSERGQYIYYRKDRNKWQVKVKQKHIGLFESYDEALEARQRSADNLIRAAIEYEPALPRNKRAKIELSTSDKEQGDADRNGAKYKEKVKYISYYPNQKKWIVRLGTQDNRKYIGGYSTYEEALSALESHYQSKQTASAFEMNQRTTYKTKPIAEPPTSFVLMKHNKIDPTYLVGMPVMLFNPVDNRYHSGRIIDCTLNAQGRIDRCTKAPIIGSLIDNEIAKAMYLVRFREGVDGRKVAMHQWIYLEEHAVRIGGEVCWAKISNGIDERTSPYRPVQIIHRSMLDMISVLYSKEANKKGPGVSPACVLAMGFGASFFHIRIPLERAADALESDSSATVDDNKSTSDDSGIKKRPTIFPFGVRDPSWLNQILHQVRLCDEDIGLAVAMAMTEQSSNKRVRFSIENT